MSIVFKKNNNNGRLAKSWWMSPDFTPEPPECGCRFAHLPSFVQVGRNPWYPPLLLLPSPAESSNVSVTAKTKRAALLSRAAWKTGRNPSWSRASCSASGKKKKKASRTIPWLFLFGHVGGPDRCIGRTFWQSRDESPNYTPYQPVHRAACTQRVFLQATTHTHTCLKTLVFFQVSPHLHFKWVRERCFFSYKMSDAGQIPTSLSRKSCSDNIISLASGLVGCVRGERGLKGEQS